MQNQTINIGDLLQWKNSRKIHINSYVIVVYANNKKGYFMTLPLGELDDMDQHSSWSYDSLVQYFIKVS